MKKHDTGPDDIARRPWSQFVCFEDAVKSLLVDDSSYQERMMEAWWRQL